MDICSLQVNEHQTSQNVPSVEIDSHENPLPPNSPLGKDKLHAACEVAKGSTHYHDISWHGLPQGLMAFIAC